MNTQQLQPTQQLQLTSQKREVSEVHSIVDSVLSPESYINPNINDNDDVEMKRRRVLQGDLAAFDAVISSIQSTDN